MILRHIVENHFLIFQRYSACILEVNQFKIFCCKVFSGCLIPKVTKSWVRAKGPCDVPC